MSQRRACKAQPLRDWRVRCPQDHRRARAAARALLRHHSSRDGHRVRLGVDTAACVANEQRRDTRGHRSRRRDRDRRRTTSNQRVCQGIERMPKSAALPRSQVSLRELSELSRIQAN